MDWLKQQEPVILWDDKGHAPPLKTNADWIRAGEIVFDAPKVFVKVWSPQVFQETKTPSAVDGTVPFYRYVVREKGKVELGVTRMRHVPHPSERIDSKRDSVKQSV